MSKPILLIDFDGVLHSYTSGWQGASVVSDAPVSGAESFIVEASRVFDVQVYSARSCQEGGIDAMKSWLELHMGGWVWDLVKFPEQKPPAFLTLDDRCICFNGTWPSIEDLRDFKPWNKQAV